MPPGGLKGQFVSSDYVFAMCAERIVFVTDRAKQIKCKSKALFASLFVISGGIIVPPGMTTYVDRRSRRCFARVGTVCPVKSYLFQIKIVSTDSSSMFDIT